jgi:ribosomal protein S12 methylthiotransferase accessory factor YcaO
LHFSWPPGAPRALLEVSERRASLLLGEFRIEMPETWVPELWGRISGALAACERRRASG